MNDRSTGQRSASCQKRKISTHLLLGETLRGRLVMSKKSLNAVKNKLLNENARKQWQVERLSCRSTCSRLTLSELSSRARQNHNNKRSPLFDPLRRIVRTDTRMCFPLEKQAATSPSLDRFRFQQTELQLQLRLFQPPYCTPLFVQASTE